MGTKRPLNACSSCGHQWYPKGRNVARKCPGCRGGDVRFVGWEQSGGGGGGGSSGSGGAGLVVLLLVGGVGYFWFSGGDKEAPKNPPVVPYKEPKRGPVSSVSSPRRPTPSTPGQRLAHPRELEPQPVVKDREVLVQVGEEVEEIRARLEAAKALHLRHRGSSSAEAVQGLTEARLLCREAEAIASAFPRLNQEGQSLTRMAKSLDQDLEELVAKVRPGAGGRLPELKVTITGAQAEAKPKLVRQFGIGGPGSYTVKVVLANESARRMTEVSVKVRLFAGSGLPIDSLAGDGPKELEPGDQKTYVAVYGGDDASKVSRFDVEVAAQARD